MASSWYNKGVGVVMNDVDMDSDTLKVMLVTSSYVFDADHDFVDDVSANELTVSGYTGGFNGAGRKTLANKTLTIDNANNRVYFDADNVTWSALGAGETIGGAIIIKEITNDAASVLIAYVDLTNTATTGGDVTIAWNASGIARINVV